MKKVLLALAAMVALTAPAVAQSSPGLAAVVAACGTPPSTYSAGTNRPLTQNTSGQTCSASSSSGGTVTANQGTPNAGGANSWPVVIGTLATSGDTTIATGGTAQSLFSGATPTNGWKVANPNLSDDLWCSDSTTTPAQNAASSVRVFANGGQYATEPGEKPLGPVYCVGATTGDFVVARKW